MSRLHRVTPTAKDVDDFDFAIGAACIFKSENPIEGLEPPTPLDWNQCHDPEYFHAADGSLIVSFDGKLRPFLVSSRGWNQGPDKWYIPPMSDMLFQVELVLATREQRKLSRDPGGRMFLSNAGVYRKPDGRTKVAVLEWDLPAESAYLHGDSE